MNHFFSDGRGSLLNALRCDARLLLLVLQVHKDPVEQLPLTIVIFLPDR